MTMTARGFWRFLHQWRWIIAFCSLSCSTSGQYRFHDSGQERFAKELKRYEISLPWRLTEKGDFLSHRVHYKINSNAVRSKRDAEDDTLHYRLLFEGKNTYVAVKPNYKLISPGFVIESKKVVFNNISDSHIVKYNGNQCHFVGTVINQTSSSVALSTCNGLHGFVKTKDGDFFIEPVKGHDLTEEDKPHPHLVYRRSALPREYTSQTGSCPVFDDKLEETRRERWEKHRRTRRSAEQKTTNAKGSYSLERNVETLVVVDREMMEYYKADSTEDIKTYVLTIMNMVAKMYHESTVGNAVNIVIVKLMLLENDLPDLKITHHAENTLDSFCKYQSTINPKEGHPNHHDVAVLLTRFNICSRMNEPCGTLGLSQVSGLCQPLRSCNINEDTGLALAFTVAHELGHNFGMPHDTSANGCEARRGEFLHVMSPLLNAEASPLIWSNCSRDAITRFFDRDWGYCLDNEPVDHPEMVYPLLSPGMMYDADHQCRLQYGSNARYCHGIDNPCTTMWCQVNKQCLTRLEAAAEGTKCGKEPEHHCFGGRCVSVREAVNSISGEWGGWAEWTECSRSCGAGVTVSQRHCDNPPPSNGGKYCLGERKRYRICNEDKNCDPDQPTFRHQQCSQQNAKPYKGQYHQWEPYVMPMAPCQLHCKPTDAYFSAMFQDAMDGTSCQPGTHDMCISGRCRHVGCDWVIDSSAKEDHCGVCHGDGSTCETVQTEFKKEVGLGYVEATVIPIGARNIRVEEVAEANNYIAVRNDQNKYYLNGDYFINWSGEYEAAGTTIHYTREKDRERIDAPGPILESLHVMLLFQSENPGVKFEFTVPSVNTTGRKRQDFDWKYQDWTHCTSSCGRGTQKSAVVCEEKEGGIVEDFYCNKSTKPDDMQRTCNEQSCPARWWSGPWQHCSVTCGDSGVRVRTVMCAKRLGVDEQVALQEVDCNKAERPTDMELCHNSQPCPGDTYWMTGEWSDTCHDNPCDIQIRQVVCNDDNAQCDPQTRPTDHQLCGGDANTTTTTSCGDWQATPWSDCTQSCDGGIQFRSVVCVNGNYCANALEPKSMQDCNEQPCNISSNQVQQNCIGNMCNISCNGKSCNASSDDDMDDLLNSIHPMVTENDDVTLYNISRDIVSEETNEIGGLEDRRRLTVHANQAATAVDKDSHGWTVGNWTQCSATCGEGVQTRDVTCAGVCDQDDKPSAYVTCHMDDCVIWKTSDWSKCSLTCGDGGVRRRDVWCSNLNGAVAWSCDVHSQPMNMETCAALTPCPTSAVVASTQLLCMKDLFPKDVCEAMMEMGKCERQYVRNRCCKTCATVKRDKQTG